MPKRPDNCSTSIGSSRWAKKNRQHCALPSRSRMETGDLVANKRGTHRLYEAAGLSAMVDVGRDPYVSSAEAALAKERHLRLIHEKGVRAAVRERDTGWDDEVSKV